MAGRPPPRVALFGVGGIGGWLGAGLSEPGAGRAEVVLIARGAHGQAIRERGLCLRVRSGGESGPIDKVVQRAPGDVEAYESVAEAVRLGARPVDYVVLGVKAWQVAEAAAEAAPLLADGGCVVTTQNGVEAPAEAAAALGPARVMGGICKVLAFIAEPGVVEMQREPAIFQFGEVYGPDGAAVKDGGSARAERLAASFAACAGANVSVAPAGAWTAIWEKAIMMCCMGPVGALCRAALDVLCKVPETRGLLRAAMVEVARCAEKAGHLPEGQTAEGLVELNLGYLGNAKPGITSSTLRDVVTGKPSELHQLTGGIRRAGQRLGVPTPTHDVIFAALLPQEMRARGEICYDLMGVPGGAPHVSAAL